MSWQQKPDNVIDIKLSILLSTLTYFSIWLLNDTFFFVSRTSAISALDVLRRCALQIYILFACLLTYLLWRECEWMVATTKDKCLEGQRARGHCLSCSHWRRRFEFWHDGSSTLNVECCVQMWRLSTSSWSRPTWQVVTSTSCVSAEVVSSGCWRWI